MKNIVLLSKKVELHLSNDKYLGKDLRLSCIAEILTFKTRGRNFGKKINQDIWYTSRVDGQIEFSIIFAHVFDQIVLILDIVRDTHYSEIKKAQKRFETELKALLKRSDMKLTRPLPL